MAAKSSTTIAKPNLAAAATISFPALLLLLLISACIPMRADAYSAITFFEVVGCSGQISNDWTCDICYNIPANRRGGYDFYDHNNETAYLYNALNCAGQPNVTLTKSHEVCNGVPQQSVYINCTKASVGGLRMVTAGAAK